MEDEAEATGTEADVNGSEGEKTPKTTPATPEKPGKAKRDERIREERNTLRTTLADVQAELKAQREAREAAEKAAFEATKKAVAAKHRLPDELTARLVGANEAELEADAAKLAALLPKAGGTTTTTTTSPANPAGTPAPVTTEELKKMTADQIDALWDTGEVQKTLSGK